MSAPEPSTCRRGHVLTAETVRFRRLVRNGKESLIRECRECIWELALAASEFHLDVLVGTA